MITVDEADSRAPVEDAVRELTTAVRELLDELRAELARHNSPLITGAEAVARFERLPLAGYRVPLQVERPRKRLIFSGLLMPQPAPSSFEKCWFQFMRSTSPI